MSEYEKQASDFLAKIGATFEARFLRHGKHFADDKEDRDIYDCVLKRDEPRKKSLSVTFGQSIAHSGEWMVKDKNPKFTKTFGVKARAYDYAGKIGNSFNVKKNPNQKAPTAYDLLTCLTKSDPNTFEDFCSEYGYDNDSIKAKGVFESVVEEWKRVEYFFSIEELEQLQDIN